MNYLVRDIAQNIQNKLQANKVVIIFGARRVGKTMLVKEILNTLNEPVLILNGEDINVHDKLSIRSAENYRQLLGSYKFLYIDEVQKIPEIGLKLKLMIDEIEGLKIIISGSSSLDIHNNAGEPLTGRKYSFNLFALSENEYNQVENKIVKTKPSANSGFVKAGFRCVIERAGVCTSLLFFNFFLSNFSVYL